MRIDDTERDGDDAILRFDTKITTVRDSIVEDDDAKYEFEVRPDEAEMDDGVILTANRAACLALSKILGQMALGDVDEGFSIRIGWDETDAVGVRIVLDESGRVDHL